MANLLPIKARFIERFKSGHSLRLQMSLILLATVGAGLLATRIMLHLGFKNVVLRYPLTVVAAYLIFFLGIKLWLKLVVAVPARGRSEGSADVISVAPDFSSGGAGHSGAEFKGGGGNFGGGGASGSFVADAVVTEGGAEAASGAMETAGGTVAAAGGAAGDGASNLDLGDAGLALVVLGAIALLVCGVGVYLIYEAQVILSEAAFQVVLAAGLVRGAKRLQDGDWLGSVFKATWAPLSLTLVLALSAGLLIHHYFPGVTRVSELLHR